MTKQKTGQTTDSWKEEEIDNKNKIDLLNSIFKDSFGYSLSSNYREKNKINDKSLTYGEIDFKHSAKLFEFIKPTANKIFYDLGSGTGRSCFAAIIIGEFKKAVGIEIVPDLHQKAQELKFLMENLTSYNKELAQKLEFTNDDFLKQDFQEADVIFCNATCFSEEILSSLTTKFKNLKIGSFIILTTKKLMADEFELIYKTKEIGYSWGFPTTTIYQKIR